MKKFKGKKRSISKQFSPCAEYNGFVYFYCFENKELYNKFEGLLKT